MCIQIKIFILDYAFLLLYHVMFMWWSTTSGGMKMIHHPTKKLRTNVDWTCSGCFPHLLVIFITAMILNYQLLLCDVEICEESYWTVDFFYMYLLLPEHLLGNPWTLMWCRYELKCKYLVNKDYNCSNISVVSYMVTRAKGVPVLSQVTGFGVRVLVHFKNVILNVINSYIYSLECYNKGNLFFNPPPPWQISATDGSPLWSNHRLS